MRYFGERLEDVSAGILTGGIGLFIILEGVSYRMGTLQSMGPGYFPVILGAIMMLLALVMLVTAQPSSVPMTADKDQLRGVAFLAAGFVGFALTIETLGMLVAIALAVFLSALANRRTPLLVALALAAGTAIASWLIFSVGLGLQIKAF